MQDIYSCPICSEPLHYTDEYYPHLENIEEYISTENYLVPKLSKNKKAHNGKEDINNSYKQPNRGVYCGSPSMSCSNYHLVPLCSYTCLPLPPFASHWECPLCAQKNMILIPKCSKNIHQKKSIEEERIQEDIDKAIQQWLPVPGVCVNSTVRCIFCNIKTEFHK